MAMLYTTVSNAAYTFCLNDALNARTPTVSRRDSEMTTVNALPNELITMVFTSLTDYDDTLALGLTNCRFWTRGRTHVISMLTRRHASPELWPRDRIILIASSTDSLPQDLEVGYLGPAPINSEEEDWRLYDLLDALEEDINKGTENVLLNEPRPIPSIMTTGINLVQSADRRASGRGSNLSIAASQPRVMREGDAGQVRMVLLRGPSGSFVI